MTRSKFITLQLLLLTCIAVPTDGWAAGGTSPVASQGQKAHVSASWPEGVGDIVNDPSRTNGWNSWFSEWPNDVNQYAFDVESSDTLNRLIAKLAETKAKRVELRLCYLREPNGLGWVTRLPEGNGVPAIFSIGDQEQINQWYGRVRKPFGVMEFTAAPVAVVPTLTLFVANEKVRLDELEIPANVIVLAGYVPTVFHRSNTVLEQQQIEKQEAEQLDGEATAAKRSKLRESLDAEARSAFDQIEKFISSREEATP